MTAIHPETRTLEVENLQTKEKKTESYDELVLATGAKPIVPEIFKAQQANRNLFRVRNIQDAAAIHSFIEKKSRNKPQLLVQALLIRNGRAIGS